MKTAIAAVLLLAGLLSAAAQEGTRTVNGWTQAERQRAEAAVRAAGFTPGEVAYAQGGAVFIYGIKGDDKYLITVTPDGQAHAGPTPYGNVTPPGR